MQKGAGAAIGGVIFGIVGGVAGFFIGGPVGVAAGAAIGVVVGGAGGAILTPGNPVRLTHNMVVQLKGLKTALQIQSHINIKKFLKLI